MTQFDVTQSGTQPRSRPKGRPNVYTVLCILATLALAFGIVVVWMQYRELFGSTSFWEVATPPTSSLQSLLPWA